MSFKNSFDGPFQLLPIFRERVWGRESLAPFFPESAVKQRIGEVWFTFEENRAKTGESLGELISAHPEILGEAFDKAHPGICPLLVKLLFTTERLSVQVHPGDDYAQKHHGSLGKTEAWHVLDAQPPAEVAVGFKESLSPAKLEDSARSGEIEKLLDWRQVRAGDTIFVPAGTVHAIGAGLTVCEVQENSDITYRLYDYGRPRELQLEHGIEVSDLEPHQYRVDKVVLAEGRDELVACRYFRIERLRVKDSLKVAGGLKFYLLLICVKGSGQIAGEVFTAGECWMVPAGGREFMVEGAGSEWILTYTADAALPALSLNRLDAGSLNEIGIFEETLMTPEEQEHAIRLLQDAYAAFNRGDIADAVKSLDPEIEWVEPPEFPGGGTYNGRSGVADYLTHSRAGWAEGSSQPEKFIPAGARIVVFVHARIRLVGSDDWREVVLADVYTFKHGTPVAMRAFAKREDALRWAGIADDGN